MDVVRGALAGLAGGLLGGAVQSLLAPRLAVEPSPPKGVDPDEHRPADAEAAHQLADALGREIPEEREELAASIVHYAIAGSIGALYGALAARYENVTTARGAAFGAAVWAMGDEVASRLFDLADRPDRYPVSSHAYGSASNAEDGMTTEAVRRPPT